MNAPAAIQADYCNFKRVRGRRVLVLEVEVPLEREREVFDVLGFPDPATGCPVAIAPLNLSTDEQRAQPERRRWSDLLRVQQAGIRCQDKLFRRWIEGKYGWLDRGADEAAVFVRTQCGVSSRAELDRNDQAALAWDQLDAEFQAWAGYLPEERG